MARVIGTASDNTTLLYELFAGEVLAEFAKTTVSMDTIRQRTLPKGAKSISFPKLGTATAGYHTAGQNIISTDAEGYANTTTAPRGDVYKGEKIIYADKNLISSVLIDDLEAKLLAWDARGEYSKLLGRSIGEKIDQTIMRVIFNGAGVASGADYTGHPGGIAKTVNATAAGTDVATLTTAANVATDIPLFLTSLMEVKTAMDSNSVPMEGRVCVIPPAIYNWLLSGALKGIASGLFINRDVGGAGSVSTGGLGDIAGFKIVMSNNMPFSNFTSTDHRLISTEGNTYTANTSALAALCYQTEAAGMVKVSDLAIESEYMTEYQADLLVAKLACGVDVLRPEACAKITVT
jgi:hypothetical protein